MTDDNAEDDGLESLRAMWLSLPDEDPPDRGFAELMAAARVKADEMAPRKPSASLWQRFVETFRRPPVLALATVTVLVGGAALLAQRGDRMEAQAPAATQPAAEEHDLAPASPQAVAPDPAAAGPSVAPPPPEPPAASEATATAPVRTERPARKRSPSKQMSSGRTAAPSDDNVRAESTSLLEDAADEKADKATATSSTLGGEAGGAAPNAPAPTPSQLRDRARAAAARGDCETAKALARRIEKQDAAYYASQVARDAALATCLKR